MWVGVEESREDAALEQLYISTPTLKREEKREREERIQKNNHRT